MKEEVWQITIPLIELNDIEGGSVTDNDSINWT